MLTEAEYKAAHFVIVIGVHKEHDSGNPWIQTEIAIRAEVKPVTPEELRFFARHAFDKMPEDHARAALVRYDGEWTDEEWDAKDLDWSKRICERIKSSQRVSADMVDMYGLTKALEEFS